MSHTEKKHDQYYEMANAPISHIIPKLAAPTIVSMLISSIYNMADTFFVSQLGTSASGAVGVIFSAMSIIQALAFMIGMGSGNYMTVPLVPEKENWQNRSFLLPFLQVSSWDW